MNNVNKDDLKKKLDDFIRENKNLFNYLTETTKCHQEKYRFKNVIKCNEFLSVNDAVFIHK